MARFYTGQGDDGRTRLLGPDRIPKYDPRPEAYGAVDEAQAMMGLVRALGCTPTTGEILQAVQQDLVALMTELAAAGQAHSRFADRITAEHVDHLEEWLADLSERVEMPKRFVIPGESRAGAALHLARTVVRRAERRVVRLADQGLLRNKQVLAYLNRLSSLLFVLALFEDRSSEER